LDRTKIARVRFWALVEASTDFDFTRGKNPIAVNRQRSETALMVVDTVPNLQPEDGEDQERAGE